MLLFDVPGAGIANAAPPVRVEPRLTLVYDSNIARSSKEAAELRGLERADFVYSPGVNFTLGVPVGNQSLYLDSDLAYDFHERNDQLNSSRIRAEGGARLRFSRCSGTVSGIFTRQRSELEDLLDVAPVKNTEIVRTVAVDGQCGGLIGFVPTFGLSRSWTDNNQDLREFSNSVTSSAKGGLSYVRPTFGEIEFTAEVRQVRYPDRPEIEALSTGYDLTSLGARFERSIGSRLRGSVGIFHTSVDSTDGRGDFTGLTSNADISYRFSDRLQTQMTFSRDVQPASLGIGDFIVSSSYAARADYGLTPRVTFHAGTGLEGRRTEGELLPLGTLVSERRYSGFGRIAYKRSNRASVDLEVRQEIRKAKPELFDYSSTRATMNLRYGL